MDSRVVVTAAEFTRQFGQLRHEPGDTPVIVTHHGRETHVLLTRRRYDELQDVSAEVVPEATAFGELVKALPFAAMLIDQDMRIRFANPAALALLQVTDAAVSQPLLEAVSAIADTLIESYVRRTLRSGESVVADLPSPFRPGAWLQIDVRPCGSLITILLRDITDDVLRYRLADRSQAVADAVRLHPQIGQVVLNVRGHIEAIDESVCTLLGLSAGRLTHLPLADLIPPAGRAAFREAIDAVLRDQGPAEFALDLLTNSGQTAAMAATLVELRGLYGSEGAVLLLARR